jgi:transcriptional regulator with XRE-family HTH domain
MGIWTGYSRNSNVVTVTAEQLLTIANLRERCRSGAARALRLSAGLSLQDVSNASGPGVSTLWRWETGARRPLATPAALRYAELLEALADRNRPKRHEELLPPHRLPHRPHPRRGRQIRRHGLGLREVRRDDRGRVAGRPDELPGQRLLRAAVPGANRRRGCMNWLLLIPPVLLLAFLLYNGDGYWR